MARAIVCAAALHLRDSRFAASQRTFIGARVDLVWTILIGLLAGVVAKLLTPGSGPRGFLLTSALGIGGSLVATYLGRFMGLYSPGQSAGFIGAVVGAVVLLVGYHLASSK
jgi:uncharacterized membrane protein YeaQ/YmgE (transglycosylase-associated protein family)